MRQLAVLFSLLCTSLHAWGPEGHRLVAQIAQGMLTPAAADRVRATLAPGESIVALSSWADETRKIRKETEPWHFIDIPIDSSGLDMKRDCPPAGCVISKIAEFRKRWRDDTLPAPERREALLFLVHFIGDMHEPLHCANHDDRGGNDVMVEFGETRTDLHHFWDATLLQHMPAEQSLFSALTRSITPAEKANWSRGSVEDWAQESFEAAKRVTYGRLPKGAPGQPVRLGKDYEEQAAPIVRRQIEKAGVRLAAVLNETP